MAQNIWEKKKMKFSEFLESRMNWYGEKSENILITIAKAVLEKIQGLPRQNILNHIYVKVGVFNIYGFDYTVLVGTSKGKPGRSEVLYKLKKLFIDYSWIQQHMTENIIVLMFLFFHVFPVFSPMPKIWSKFAI